MFAGQTRKLLDIESKDQIVLFVSQFQFNLLLKKSHECNDVYF